MAGKVTNVQSNPGEISVTDRRGRVLTLKKPNVLAQYGLVELLGATAENRVYLAMVMPLLYLQAIDGVVANFSNRRELDAIIQELDEDGISALQQAITDNFPAPDDESAKAAAKKSPGTPDSGK